MRGLLDKGVNPGLHNSDGQTGLHWATYGPHVEVVELLLNAGAPVDVEDGAFHATPLRWALFAWANGSDAADRERACRVIALMIRAGAQLDQQSLDPRLEHRVRSDPRPAGGPSRRGCW